MSRHRSRGTPTQLDWPLFDEAWYLQRYPEVALAGLDARMHFRERGEASGYRPNPLFDSGWYATQHAAELECDESPLAFFIERGGVDRPNPLFDPTWYRETHSLDPNQHPCALTHYLAIGAANDLAPHPLFDPAWYCERYPEVRSSGANPFAHYIEHGEAAGYWPNPWFDPEWVRERNLESNVEQTATGPLHYYVEIGSKNGARPHPMFDPEWVRNRYPTAESTRVEPLAHFLARGEPAGHAPNAFADPANPHAPSTWIAKFSGLLERARAEAQRSSNGDDVLFAYLDRLAETSASDSRVFKMAPLTAPTDDRVPLVSIIVPTYNQPACTLACVYSILSARTRTAFEVIVSDDASSMHQRRDDLFVRLPNVRFVQQDSNLGFLRNCNTAATEARGEFVLFLNNDTLVTDDWLDELVATFDRFPDVGIVGSKLLFPNGRIAEAGGIVWRDASAWNFGRHRSADDRGCSYAREVDYVSGASLLLPKALFEELRGFDERFAPAYFEDTDLAFRVRREGKRVVYQPNSEVIHFEGVSSGTDVTRGIKRHQEINQALFAERWGSLVAHHGERGIEPGKEKDRSNPRNALVIDVCLPTPQRDARSQRLFNMMKLLRDDGFKTSFLAETFDADEAFLRELRGSGIDVLDIRSAAAIESFLRDEASHYDVCLLARPAVEQRWLNVVEEHLPKARIICDLSDLWRDGTPIEPHTGNHGRIRRLADHGSSLHANPLANSATNLPHIHEPLVSPRAASERLGIWVVTGFQEDVAADSILWLRGEIIPALDALLHADDALNFYLRHRDWTDHITAGCESLHSVDESRLVEPTALDSFRVAVAPIRFGASLSSQIEAVLSRGIPCVATSRAAMELTGASSDAVVIADTAAGIAEAIMQLYDNEQLWRDASSAALQRTASHYPYREAARVLRSAAG